MWYPNVYGYTYETKFRKKWSSIKPMLVEVNRKYRSFSERKWMKNVIGNRVVHKYVKNANPSETLTHMEYIVKCYMEIGQIYRVKFNESIVRNEKMTRRINLFKLYNIFIISVIFFLTFKRPKSRISRSLKITNNIVFGRVLF